MKAEKNKKFDIKDYMEQELGVEFSDPHTTPELKQEGEEVNYYYVTKDD